MMPASRKKIFIQEKKHEAHLNTFMAVKSFAITPKDPPDYMPPDRKDTFEAVLAIKAIFRCGRNAPMEYEEACRRAEHQLTHKMYEDFLSILLGAQSAAYSGDQRKAVELISMAIKMADTYRE